MATYSESLKHPMWQRKRLEILNRDGFKCMACGATDKTLHVHHLMYVKGREPWNYPNSSLVTLCEDCHEYEHNALAESREAIISSLRERGALHSDLIALAVSLDLIEESPRLDKDEWMEIACIIRLSIQYRNAGRELSTLREYIVDLFRNAEEG